MTAPAKFFAYLKTTDVLGPVLTQEEVDGTNAVLNALAGLPIADVAYGLATAYHETAHTMLPIKEFGGPSYFRHMYDVTGHRPTLAKKNGNTRPGDGVLYFGRGYVQLTWYNNYFRFAKLLGIPLAAQPDLALRPEIAAKIMRLGMVQGLFTGKAFKDFLPRSGPATLEQFIDARPIINGTDKARLIANYAVVWQTALQRGGYRAAS